MDIETRELMDAIREIIQQNKNMQYLPSLRVLRSIFHKGNPKILKALHRMRETGELEFHRGKRIRIPGRLPRPQPLFEPTKGRLECLYEKLEGFILTGELKTGTELPKPDFLAEKEGVSVRTVGRVYRRLLANGLVSRHGSRFITGRLPDPAFIDEQSQAVVLVIQPKYWYWHSLKNQRYGGFIRNFSGEAETWGIQMQPCFMNKVGEIGKSSPQGAVEIQQLAKKLGDLYLGALITGQPKDSGEFKKILKGLHRLHRPIVWFDRKPPDSTIVKGMPGIHCCWFHETHMAESVVKLMRQSGHQKAGFLHSGRHQSWKKNRLKCLRQVGGIKPEIKFECFENRAECLLRLTDDELQRLLQSQQVHRLAFKMDGAELRNRILRELDNQEENDYEIHLVSMLLDPDITLLLSPQDYITRHYFSRLKEMNLHVPGQISLMSFDNYLDPIDLPVTTIGIGTERMGYSAFHTILQDIPIHTAPDGGLHHVPHISRRGTVKRLR